MIECSMCAFAERYRGRLVCLFREVVMVDWNQARQFWRDGLDTYDIAKFFGVPESDIWQRRNS